MNCGSTTMVGSPMALLWSLLLLVLISTTICTAEKEKSNTKKAIHDRSGALKEAQWYHKGSKLQKAIDMYKRNRKFKNAKFSEAPKQAASRGFRKTPDKFHSARSPPPFQSNSWMGGLNFGNFNPERFIHGGSFIPEFPGDSFSHDFPGMMGPQMGGMGNMADPMPPPPPPPPPPKKKAEKEEDNLDSYDFGDGSGQKHGGTQQNPPAKGNPPSKEPDLNSYSFDEVEQAGRYFSHQSVVNQFPGMTHGYRQFKYDYNPGVRTVSYLHQYNL